MTDCEFIKKTNKDYAAWCKTYYQQAAQDGRGMVSLHGLWAWQEQEKRINELRDQVTLLRDALKDVLWDEAWTRGVIATTSKFKAEEALAATEQKT
jgi:hypothetical protein